MAKWASASFLLATGLMTSVSWGKEAPAPKEDASAAEEEQPAQGDDEQEPSFSMDDPIPPPPPSSEEDGDLPQVFSTKEERSKKSMRWTGAGAFVGLVGRPSDSDTIHYNAGVAYGGYFRPQLMEWMGLRLFYREERIFVDLEPGAFDWDGDAHNFDFRQPPLKVVNLGAHLEPTWVIHPRFRVLGVAGLSWVRFVAEMPEADGFDFRADRAAVELNWTLGAGIEYDLVPNWLDFSVTATHSFVSNQTGDAFNPAQAVVDGKIVHLAPMPAFKRAGDLIFSLGLVL